VSGPIGLHGGGEFMAGDEPFLLALLEAAPRAADAGAIRVVVVPTAAARHRPDATARDGREAIERVAAAANLPVSVETALIVDSETANDPALADRLAKADLIYLPGGDSDLLPGLMPDSLAWRSILAAHARGAVIAGASAGAMALGPRTWTPNGWLNGLGLVHGLVVVPHYNGFDPRGWEAALAELNAAGLGYLGIDERTGVLSSPNGTASATWRVVGPGRVVWFPLHGERVSGTSGATIPLPG
jgi:cyanophycinase-like exopeptidase